MSVNPLRRTTCSPARRGPRRPQRGVTLLEVLVAVLVLLFGLLGMAGVQVRATQAEFESYQRTQALILLQDMAGRLQANRLVASCYGALTVAAAGAPYAGSGATLPLCAAGSIEQNAVANADLAAWSNALLGSAEQQGGNVGAMIGARGCIAWNGGNDYTITVAWQGLSATAAPPAALNCGIGQYGADDALRRVVSTTLRVAILFP